MGCISRFSWGLASLLLIATTVATSAAEPERKDDYGKPLPAGALGRLGAQPFPSGMGGRKSCCTKLSPDGQHYAILEQAAVSLCSVKTGIAIHTWSTPNKNTFYPLGFSPDGRFLAIILGETIQLCEVGGQWKISSFQWKDRNYMGVPLFSADGKRFTLQQPMQFGGGDEPRKIVITDVEQKKTVGSLPLLHTPLLFLPTANSWPLPVASIMKMVVRCNCGTLRGGKELKQHAFPNTTILAMTFSPNGEQLAVVEGDGGVRFWDLKTWNFATSNLPTSCRFVDQLRYTPDTRTLIMNYLDSPVVVLDIASGECKRYPLPADTALVDLVIQPQGRMVALGTSGTSTSARIWELPSGKMLSPDGMHTGRISGLVFSRDRRALLSCGSDGIRLWDISQLTESDKPLPRTSSRFFAQPDGQVLQTSSQPSLFFLSPGSKPLLVEPRNARALAEIPWHGDRVETDWGTYDTNQVAIFGDDKKLARFVGISVNVSPRNELFSVELWDLKTGLHKGSFAVPQPSEEKLAVSLATNSFVLSDDGHFLALHRTIKRNETPADVLLVWDLRTGKEVVHQVREKQALQAMTFSPDSRLLYSAYKNGAGVEVWDIEKAKALPPLKADMLSEVTSLRFSPDGRLLVAATSSEYLEKPAGRLIVWEMASGSVRHVFVTGQWTGSLALSADSQILASGGGDGSILFWNLAAHGETARLPDKLSAEQAAESWQALANPAADKAYPTMRRLIRNPPAALALFRARAGSDADKQDQESLLRQVRMVEILERIGTADAKDMLQQWASGDSKSRQAAAAALKRLAP